MTDLNAERKLRDGRRDTGRCSCGRYRLFCRNGCLSEAERPLSPWSQELITRYDRERNERLADQRRAILKLVRSTPPEER